MTDIPIVAVTAYTGAKEELKCKEIGMDDFIPKPCSYRKIKEVLDKWLK